MVTGDLPEAADGPGQRLLVHLGVAGGAAARTGLRKRLLEGIGVQMERDLGEHLDEATVGVQGEASVAGLPGEPFYGLIVEAKVEDGVHHAGHGVAGAGADGHEERAVRGAEAAAKRLFYLLKMVTEFIPEAVGQLAVVAVVVAAGLGGNGKARRHWQVQAGHFGKVGPLAAQKVSHGGAAFREAVDVFHLSVPPSRRRRLFIHMYGTDTSKALKRNLHHLHTVEVLYI
ncbi:hypothetical protein LCGC14_1911810, partial [marine sediment metagenome]